MRKKKHYHRGRRTKRGGKGRIVSTVVLIVSAFVFCFSAFQLYKIISGYSEGRGEYEDIRALALQGTEAVSYTHLESYITGMLRIREILDFWQYRNALDEGFEWKNVQSLIEKAKWQEFVHQVHVLASLWFDSGIRQQDVYKRQLRLRFSTVLEPRRIFLLFLTVSSHRCAARTAVM